MVTVMSAFAVSAAELSNMFSVVATLIFFISVFILIMRNAVLFRWPDDMVLGGTLHHAQPRIPQMKMMKITIPFIIKLDETSKSSTCINFTVTSQITYTIRVFWGVSIRDLHMFLWKPWSVMQKSVASGDMLKGFYQMKGLEMRSEPHQEKKISLTFPEPTLDLGTPPRLCYPLVIFIVRDEDPHVTIHPYESVALINVVHIKDSVCTLPTSILAQYLKQANGRLSCLKQLYVAAGNNINAGDPMPDGFNKDDVSVWALAGEQLCVVCQYYPVSRALMPCRHTCVCSVCFEKLDRCPMCRSPFSSYFTVRNEDYSPRETDTPELKQTPLNWILNWNDRFFNFLGHQ